MEIKSILFPTDFLEGSSHAFKYAVDMAKRYGAKLYLVHVIHDILKGTGLHVPHPSLDILYKDIWENATKEIERYGLKELAGIKDVEHHVLKGIPHEEIVRFANEKKIDLIVMGTYGKKGIERMFFGSTASHVVRYAPCPVLTVRIPTE